MSLQERFTLISLTRCFGLCIVLDDDHGWRLKNNSLIALSLELDEDYFIQMHDFSANAETFRE